LTRLRRKECCAPGQSAWESPSPRSGVPTVSIGIVASALWLIRRDGGPGNLATPEHDQGARTFEKRWRPARPVRKLLQTPAGAQKPPAKAKGLKCAWMACTSSAGLCAASLRQKTDQLCAHPELYRPGRRYCNGEVVVHPGYSGIYRIIKKTGSLKF